MESTLSSLHSDGFGYWLAGLIDGEGSFAITPNRPGFVCRLSVSLREDDSSILYEIARRTGIGKTSPRPRASTADFQRRAQTIWRVEKKSECLVAVAIFDRFPLRAKKADDFAIWKRAVIEMTEMQRDRSSEGRWQRMPLDWSGIANLKEELRLARERRLQHTEMEDDQV